MATVAAAAAAGVAAGRHTIPNVTYDMYMLYPKIIQE